MKNFSAIESLKASRSWSFAVITVIYLIAAALGVWTFLALDDMAVMLRLFVADLWRLSLSGYGVSYSAIHRFMIRIGASHLR